MVKNKYHVDNTLSKLEQRVLLSIYDTGFNIFGRYFTTSKRISATGLDRRRVPKALRELMEKDYLIYCNFEDFLETFNEMKTRNNVKKLLLDKFSELSRPHTYIVMIQDRTIRTFVDILKDPGLAHLSWKIEPIQRS